MKIKIVKTIDGEYLESQKMFINDKEDLHIRPLTECPEDAIIGRDLISCEDILEYMKTSYEAGKNGEKLEIEIEKKDYIK